MSDNLNITETNPYGRQSDRGNMLGIEPYVLTSDYHTLDAITAKLDGYLAKAQSLGWLNERTIVIWPEYIATWLAVTGETPATLLSDVVKNIAAAHPADFNKYYASALEQNKAFAAAFRTKAADMASMYQTLFAGLSKKYSVTSVAGSIVLPSPQVARGKITFDVNGPLYNVSAVFNAKGQIFPDLVYKAYPTGGELPYTACAPAGDMPVYETPAGRLGVLICADSWYPSAYTRMKEAGAQLLAVPSFGHGGLKSWGDTWPGYAPWPNPSDVDPKDINKISNSDAWLKYSLATRIEDSSALFGINVFLHGSFWPDLVAGGGVAVVVRRDKIWKREIPTEGATLNNLWL